VEDLLYSIVEVAVAIAVANAVKFDE